MFGNFINPVPTEDEEKRLENAYARNNDAILERKKLRAWYEAEEKKLKDPNLTIDDLENNELWFNQETAKKFDEEKFASQTDDERLVQTEEEILSGEFREKRKNEIARRKLDSMVDEIIARPPSLEAKMANLTQEQHRALFDKLFE